jgi:tRNA 2-thiocytidine biosynthesis protein TtcA
MFAALSNVAPSLLLDGRLFDFGSLRAEHVVSGDEDAWLDQDGA